MLTIHPPFRCTTVDDAGTLADFVEFASEGLALYLWTKIAEPGCDPWQIGRERVLSETSGLSYRNAVIADVSGQPASGLISYPLKYKSESILDELSPVLVPLHKLMNQALDTWYVHVLASYPEHRGKGQGSALLAVAETLAVSAGKRGLSLLVSDTNTGARRLYEHRGYREAAHCRMVKEQWQHPGTNWMLLRKDIQLPCS